LVYVTKAYRLRETTPVVHAAAETVGQAAMGMATGRPAGNAGRRRHRPGEPVQEQGLDMLHEHAQFEDGSVSVEAGLLDMLTRMEAGRFKVFKHLLDWFEEFRLYHRKDGRVAKKATT
jgi:hypothetical protein